MSLSLNELTHSSPAHGNSYHICENINKQGWINIYMECELLISYCPLLRQNIETFFSKFQCFMLMIIGYGCTCLKWWYFVNNQSV